MVYPSKRHKLRGDPPEMGRFHKRDVRHLAPRQNVPAVVVDVTVQVTASLIISIDLDANGRPTATTTLDLPPGVAAPSLSSLAPATSTPAPAPITLTTGPGPAAAATPAPSSPAPPSLSSLPTGSISGTSPTVTGGLFSSLPAGRSNSTLSISASTSGPLPAIISVITGNNATVAAAGTSSRSSLPSSPSSIASSSSSLELSSSSLLSSSPSAFPSSTVLSSPSSVANSPTSPIVAAGGAGTFSSVATGIPNGSRNGTSKPNDNSTSPPVVAGAVVGSVGGMAVILLVLVLVARWWKHHSRNSRYEDNASQLHLNGPDGAAPTSRRSFLAAAGWLNRLSGAQQNRSSSPTLPPVAENERGFQKIAGRKLPSQFPTGTEEGPMARDFEASALPPMSAQRATHMSDTSSYYRDSTDTTHFFGAAPKSSPLARGAMNNGPQQQEPRRADPARLVPELAPFDDAHSETLMPSPARTPQFHQYPDDQYFNNNNPPHSSWPVPDDAIRPAPRR
ncbi:hypothetical protein EG328_011100 [Venturia inaequalis]|uniref:Uncharacterized protein n=1 Tax=Venturia inaequalis TaxID=5025 RepID=A0A8H3V7R1_VENIN|nr:hypothetical protein EG328_011100 [Venturia inaequalis]